MRLRKTQNAFGHTLIKQFKNEDSGLTDFEVDGRIICDWNLKSELLSDQFSSVFTNEDPTNIPVFGTNPKPGISTIIVTSQHVIKQLRPLKPNKASGHGEIPPWFFKAYAAEIVPISADIYETSIATGCVPSKWKHTIVCVVYRNGGKSDPANYKPISLTCISSNVLEHIIHIHAMKHPEQHAILTEMQHGFRAKRSTVRQLILTIHDLAETSEKQFCPCYSFGL